MLGRLRRARRFLQEAEADHTAAPDRTAPSLARDVVIVMLDPGKGKILGSYADLAVAGALLLELVREGRLDVSGTGKKMRVSVRDQTPLGDEDLDDALLTIGSGFFGHKVRWLLQLLAHPSQIVTRLVAAGLVVEESHTRLGMFTVRRHHPTPAAGRDELVAPLRSALLGESVPDDRTALLVAALYSGSALGPHVPKKRFVEALRRAEEIVEHLADDERAVVSAVRAAVDRARSSE